MREFERAAATTMDTVWRHREAGHLDASVQLFRNLGYTAEAVAFALTPDAYYFPNHRSGRLVRPAGVSEDKIPVVALEKDRCYRFEPPTIHSLQRLALLSAGFTAPEVRLTEQRFSVADGSISSSHSQHGAASVYCVRAKQSSNRPAIVSRPTMIFNVDSSEPVPDKFCASVALHEMVHVAQALSRPTYEPARELRKEVEAYAVQATLAYRFEIDYSFGLMMAGTVDAFRRRHLGDREFEPTADFVAALKQDESVSRIWHTIQRNALAS